MLGGAGHGPFAGTFDALGGGHGGPVEVVNEVNEYGTGTDSPWGGPDDSAGHDDAGSDTPSDYVDTADASDDYSGSSDDDGGGSGDDFA